MDAKHYEQERRAFHKAIQDVVREYEDEGVVLNAVICMEISDSHGKKYLAHRNFNIEGEACPSWDAEKLLTDGLRVADVVARESLRNVEDDEG